MKWKYRHIISISLLLCGLLGFVSCTFKSLELPREEEETDSNNIFLTFHAAVDKVSTRAGEQTDDRVAKLRIVIVSKKTDTPEEEADGSGDKGWKVEWNRLISDASAATLLPGGYTFKVDAGCRKRIYLIANEEGLTDYTGNRPFGFNDNSQFIPDENGKAAVDDYVFSVSYSGSGYTYSPGSLPMSAVYEFTMPDKVDLTFTNNRFEYEIPHPLYLVRAATKCSFSFTNEATSKKITVIAYGIKDVIADRMYLMPHVNRNADGKYWVVDNANAVQALENYGDRIAWVDWMIEEAKKEEATESYQWLTDYEVPESRNAEGKPGPIVPTANLELPANTGTTPAEGATKTIYLPESKTLKTGGGNPFQLQEYSVFLRTKETFLGGSGTERMIEYTAPLPDLASLFRNTHVKVKVIFYDNELTVDVIPYSEINLDPDFGLQTKK